MGLEYQMKGAMLALLVLGGMSEVLGLSKEVNGKGYPFAMMVNADACTGCANCAVVCPDSCITVYRQRFE